jgi:hypothetical protein
VVDGLDGDIVDDLDVVAAELLAEQLAELLVDGRHDRRGQLDQGHGQAAAGESLGHLQADVATADDDGRAGATGQGLVEREGVAHGVQHMHPRQVQAVDGRPDRDRPGGDDQLVIAELVVSAGRVGDPDLLGDGVDGLGRVVQ